MLEPELVGEAAEQIRSFASEQPLAVAVDEHQPPFAVEGEDRDVDLGHDRAQQRRGFLRAEPLAAQRLGQRVDLEHHLPERVVGDGAAGADREVVFAQGGEQIRDRLQWPDDPIAQRQRDTEPQPGQHDGDGHPDEQRVLAEPEQHERKDDRRQASREREQRDLAIVGPHYGAAQRRVSRPDL